MVHTDANKMLFQSEFWFAGMFFVFCKLFQFQHKTMIRFLKYIFMYPVLLLIMLHTFVPHAFTNTLTPANESRVLEERQSILGLFGWFFHEKHEQNLHDLNTIQVIKNFELLKLSQGSFFIHSIANFDFIEYVKVNVFNKHRFCYNLLIILNLTNWRGPPPCR